MKVLVIGGGGREHAIIWKLSQSRHVDGIYSAPGNAGISELAECLNINPNDFDALLNFVKYNWIDLTIVGPEEPLSKGIVDAFLKEGKRILGPNKESAQIEASKVFAKDFMRRYGIPTPEYRVFTSYIQAEDYVRLKGAPLVIKVDGLAYGKGVFVSDKVEDTLSALRFIMKERAFGSAGDRVIVEECIQGEEASFMAFIDGNTVMPMPSSQDHKRVFDGDKGPNTGGMGAYSPAPVITGYMESLIMKKVMRQALKGFRAEGIKYKGVLYAGIMIKDNMPYVLEFNCRFGDPETQSVLSRLSSDLVEIATAIIDERLQDISIKWRSDPSVCVVLASQGYPQKYEKGKPIKGLEDIKNMENVMVFHAGTSFNNNEIVTSGGRVLSVTATGKDIKTARDNAYMAVSKIHFDGMHYRKDIASRALKREV